MCVCGVVRERRGHTTRAQGGQQSLSLHHHPLPTSTPGHGSFGRVTLARHSATGRLAAVKALSKAHLVRTGQASHVQSEAAVLAALGTTSPAFIRLLAHFQDESFVYLVLEYAPGGEFFRHLRARGRLPESAARFYVAEVAAALDAMHGKGIVYRDLKVREKRRERERERERERGEREREMVRVGRTVNPPQHHTHTTSPKTCCWTRMATSSGRHGLCQGA